MFARARLRMQRMRGRPDRLNTVRRSAEEVLDQLAVRAYRRVRPPGPAAPFDGDPSLALVTVNFSTTRFLKLMLCTLGEQSHLSLLQRIVIVDNRSRDGGVTFLRALAREIPNVDLVQRHCFLNHAAGMRSGLRYLGRAEGMLPPGERARFILFCDPDVVFRNPDTLRDLATSAIAHAGAFTGEARRGGASSGHPDIQASFFLVRRDVLARRDIAPLENHGSPAYRMQSSIMKAGLRVVDFPSNHGGYVIHRGRSAVAAASAYRAGPYSGVANRSPHFMGVPEGARIWASIEERWAAMLDSAAEPLLLEHLKARFAALGAEPAEPAPDATDPCDGSRIRQK